MLGQLETALNLNANMYGYANESYLNTPSKNYNYTAITKNNGFTLVIIEVFYAHAGIW